MATTDSTMNDETEFGNAFNEEQMKAPEQTEDEAFGLTPDAEDPPAESAGVTIDDDDSQETAAGQVNADAEQAEAEAGAEPGAEPAAPAEPAEAEVVDPKDEQRAKSWEGRLRARERELEAREAALKEKPAEAEPAVMSEDGDVDDGGETAESAEETAAELSDAVASGEITADEAMKRMTEDFGPEFTKMIGVMIAAEAGKIVKPMSGTVDQLISEIKSDKQRNHFETIAEAHPDFAEIPASPAFEAYLASQGEKAADVNKVVEGGTARQIVSMLNDFKKWGEKQAAGKEPEAQADTAAADQAISDAEGVRSTGMRLPEQPNKAQDYEAAWDQF